MRFLTTRALGAAVGAASLVLVTATPATALDLPVPVPEPVGGTVDDVVETVDGATGGAVGGTVDQVTGNVPDVPVPDVPVPGGTGGGVPGTGDLPVPVPEATGVVPVPGGTGDSPVPTDPTAALGLASAQVSDLVDQLTGGVPLDPAALALLVPLLLDGLPEGPLAQVCGNGVALVSPAYAEPCSRQGAAGSGAAGMAELAANGAPPVGSGASGTAGAGGSGDGGGPTLPKTGADLAALAGLGLALVGTGFGVRRVTAPLA